MNRRLLPLILSIILPLVGVSVLLSMPAPAHAQACNIVDDYSTWVDLNQPEWYTASTSLFYTDTATTGVLVYSLSDMQATLSTTESIASDSVGFYVSGSASDGDFYATVQYTDTETLYYLYPSFFAGIYNIIEVLPDGKYLNEFTIYVDMFPEETSYQITDIEIQIPCENVGAAPAPPPTPTPIPIPTLDTPLTYTWGAVPTPIPIPTPLVTATIEITHFWDIENYEFSISVARTVWDLPYMSEIVQVAVYTGAVFLGLFVIYRIIGGRMAGRQAATTIISNASPDELQYEREKVERQAAEARAAELQKQRNRLLRDLGRQGQSRLKAAQRGANRGRKR